MSEQLSYLERFGSTNDMARCLLPLLDALGWRGSHADLIEALPHFTSSLDQSDMLNIMANLKFESKVLSTKFSKIDPRLYPCLFIPNRGPALVLVKRLGSKALVFDGGSQQFEERRLSGKSGDAVFFDMMSSETVALLKPQQNWFSKILARFRKTLLLVLFITLGLSIFTLATPLFVMTIYDQVLAADSQSTLVEFLVGVGIFLVGDFGFRMLRSKIQGFVSLRLSHIVGNEVLRRILYLPPAFTETASIGSQVSRIKDFESVREFVAGPGVIAILELPFTLLLLGVMVFLGGSIAYVPIAGLVLFMVFGLLVWPQMRALNHNFAQSGSKRQEFVVEALSSVRAIKYTNADKLWQTRFRELNAQAVWDSLQLQNSNAMINAVSHGLVSMSVLFTMVVGVTQVINEEMSLGALMACMLLVWRILGPIKSGFSVLAQTGRVKRSVVQLNKLMNFRLENKLESLLSYNHRIIGRVMFSQVSLRYSPDAHPALLGVKFKIQPKETLVIIGHDGSGKSTVLKLILGLYSPQAGQVLIDGMNVRQMDPISLRRSIGYAPQKNKLFHGTIAQNLQLAKPTASLNELIVAAKAAQLYEEIMSFEEGFETRIKRANMGQFTDAFVQKVGIAQVFLKNPPLMLIDKPENGVGLSNEQSFYQQLLKQKEESTVILVTERDSYFELADKVLWMEKGRVRLFGDAETVLDEYYQNISM